MDGVYEELLSLKPKDDKLVSQVDAAICNSQHFFMRCPQYMATTSKHEFLYQGSKCVQSTKSRSEMFPKPLLCLICVSLENQLDFFQEFQWMVDGIEYAK